MKQPQKGLPRRALAKVCASISYGCRKAGLGPLDHVSRSIDASHECGTVDQMRKRNASAESDLEDMIRRLEFELLKGKSIHLGVVPIHQLAHNATEKTCRSRELPCDESRWHCK